MSKDFGKSTEPGTPPRSKSFASKRGAATVAGKSAAEFFGARFTSPFPTPGTRRRSGPLLGRSAWSAEKDKANEML